MNPVVVDVESNVSSPTALQISPEPAIRAIAERFATRGLSVAVRTEVEAQAACEEQTSALQPAAYRLSKLSDAYIGARYRHGKEMMSGSDLIEYFSETRAMRIRNTDFSLAVPLDESQTCTAEESVGCRWSAAVRTIEKPNLRQRMTAVPKTVGRLPEQLREKVKCAPTSWFNFSKPDTTRETRRFPLSALAAIAAVAMSLMLIVAGSVMLTQGEGEVNRLKQEFLQLSNEVSELRSDLSVQNDLLTIREIAVNEYGMVDREYLRMEYLSMGGEDSIDVFEEEPPKTVGLSALLNALGILK